ncbi:restriction endonuclease subunit S [Muribaculaceae bacterium Isolate-114 (HZI)]|nr:restriction endonuclease subunit S [Muribaculaceae bacterium Isolate-114 (HZI)]
MDTQKLRQRILDLAIRGKLVPQDPNDEPASVLLDRIRAEKERLIAEGKIKRPKAKKSTDKSHYQNFTPPFDIPDSWEWVNIKEVTSKITDGTHHSPENKPIGDFLYITAKNIKYDGIKIDSATYVNSNVHTEIYSRCNPEYGDILYIKDGATAGVVAINDLNVPFSMLSSVALIKPLGILNRYLYYFLRSDFSNSSIKKSMKGVGITRITLRQIEEWNIPVPPYAEQERIVKILDNYFSILSYLEWNIDTLQESIHNAKSKILDLAMQGKLVPQNPSDEPAADMLRRINPKAKIITDNPHYPQLPDNWVLVPLEDITEYEQPQPYIVQDTFYSDTYTIPVLTAGKSFILGYTNEDFGVYENVPAIIFDDFTTDSKLVEFHFKVKSSAMKIIQVKRGLSIEYVAMFMSTTRLIGETHKRYWISEYSKILIPIPPLEEQNRIVEKVNSIYCELDKIISALSE